MADSHLNDAIDRAVRDMMAVEPDARTRARVLSAIEQPRVRAFTWTYVAAGAVALVLLMVMMRAPERPPLEQAAAPRSVPVAPQRPIAAADSHVPAATPRAAKRVERRSHEPATTTPAAALPETVPALGEIPPIVTRPPQMQTEDVDPDAIVIAPMGDLPEIAEPPGGRDERPR
jgi:hypothetical protein